MCIAKMIYWMNRRGKVCGKWAIARSLSERVKIIIITRWQTDGKEKEDKSTSKKSWPTWNAFLHDSEYVRVCIQNCRLWKHQFETV